MRNFLSLLRLAAVLAAVTGGPATAAALDLHLMHLRPGDVRVSVYADAERWRRNRGAVVVREFKTTAPTCDLRIDGLAPGRYAVRVDQASNNWPGMLGVLGLDNPRHGASGNQAAAGMPSFELAAVTVADSNVRLRIWAFTDSLFDGMRLPQDEPSTELATGHGEPGTAIGAELRPAF